MTTSTIPEPGTFVGFQAIERRPSFAGIFQRRLPQFYMYEGVDGRSRDVRCSHVAEFVTHGVTWAWGSNYQRIFDAGVEAMRLLSSTEVDFDTQTRAAERGANMALCKWLLEQEFGPEAFPGCGWQEAITRAVAESRTQA